MSGAFGLYIIYFLLKKSFQWIIKGYWYTIVIFLPFFESKNRNDYLFLQSSNLYVENKYVKQSSLYIPPAVLMKVNYGY